MAASASTSRSILRLASTRSVSVRSTLLRPLSTSSIRHAGKGPWADALPSRPLNDYIIIAEDQADAGAWSRRMEVRERHLEQAAEGKRVGRVVMGGAILKRDFKDMAEEEPKTSYISGSVMLVKGESIADVRKRISQDEYSLSQVFDPTKLRILPFLSAIAPPPAVPQQPQQQQQASAAAEIQRIQTQAGRPRSQSAVFRSRAQHREVRQVDPQPSLTLRAAERRAANSLSQLRKMQGQKLPQGPTPVTLGALRKTHIPVQ